MSSEPAEIFQTVCGRLGQRVHEEPGGNSPIELRFHVEIEFSEIEWEDETWKPLLRIDSIQTDAKSWRDLAGRTLEFPYAPKPGSVEAAVLLFGEHNPADVIKLEFGEVSDGRILVAFETEVDFEIEADVDELGQIGLSFDLPLEVEPLRVATNLEKRSDSDPKTIAETVSGSVRLEDYGEIEKQPGGFAFPVAG